MPDEIGELSGRKIAIVSKYAKAYSSILARQWLKRLLEPLLGSVAGIDLTSIDWAIVGGESGPKARPIDPKWVREIRTACRRHGAAFLSNQ